MEETPLVSILNREQARSLIAEHFSEQVALLRDVANYGSNLVMRAYNSSARDLPAIITCGVLLKQVVAMVDAVHSLVEAGAVHAAYLPARAAFEASIYLDWILFSDSDRKATCYLVSNYRDERLWNLRVIKGTPEQAAFQPIADTVQLDVHANRPTLSTDAQNQLAEINRILAQPGFAAIDKEFEKLRKGKSKRDPEWFELSGAKSIRQVAQAVHRLAEYEFFYSKGSRVTHTASYRDHIRIDKNNAFHFLPIRYLEDLKSLVQFLVPTALTTFEHVLRFYRPTELPVFRRKYLEDWRGPFFSIKNVTFKFEG